MSRDAENSDLRSPAVQRGERIRIFVNGRETAAYRGETVLAALIAAGYRQLRKAHRSGEARGAFCGMGICSECLITIDGSPNRYSCMVEAEDGMEIEIDES